MTETAEPSKRELILAAARDLLEAEGPDGLALRAVARAVELPIGNVQHYFPNKDALVSEVLKRAFADLFDVANELRAAASGTFDLDEFIRRIYSRARSRKTAIRLSLLDSIGRGTMHPDRTAELRRMLDVANLLAPAFGGAEPARLAIRTAIFALGRYAISDDDELRATVGAGPEVEMTVVHDRVATHLVAMVRGLLIAR